MSRRIVALVLSLAAVCPAAVCPAAVCPAALCPAPALAQWKRDAKLHFSLSAAMGLGFYGGIALLAPLVAYADREQVRVPVAFAATLLVGLAKELYDLRSDGLVSGRDLGWDALGAASGVFLGWLIGWSVKRYLLGSSESSVAGSRSEACLRDVL